jgi:hypothetical protein
MNDRERLLAILGKRPPDRIPWIPRLLLWYNARVLTRTMPAQWEGLTLRELERTLGVGTPARDGHLYSIRYDDVELCQHTEGGKQVTEYHTPVGTVRTVVHHAAELEAQGLPGRVEEYPLKGPADYRVWEWVVQHMRWLPAYEDYAAYDAETGQDGLPMVAVGDIPIHEFLLDLAGYDHAFYQLADYPREIEHLLSVMTEVQRERLWPVILESPARLLLHGVHLSTQFTPPRVFRRHILPYYQEFMPLAHQRGKAVAMHADNDTSQIMELIERAGWDMVECFVTSPMVPATLRRAREVWGTRVIIWGGLPSLLFSPSVPEAEFRAYVDDVLATVAPGEAFILGVADNVMPDSLIERVQYVSQVIAERGAFPLS